MYISRSSVGDEMLKEKLKNKKKKVRQKLMQMRAQINLVINAIMIKYRAINNRLKQHLQDVLNFRFYIM